jgi:hypothetical protein
VKVLRLGPLVLLAKVGGKLGRPLISEEGEAMESGLLEYSAEESGLLEYSAEESGLLKYLAEESGLWKY